MATTDTKQFYTVDQFLHNVQALPALSSDLLRNAHDGEAYEVLVRRLQDLHLNIAEFAQVARDLQAPGIEIVLHPEITNGKRSREQKNKGGRA